MGNSEEVKPNQDEFLLKEYDQVRAEFNATLAECRSLERNAVLASGAVWAWTLTHVKKVDPHCADAVLRALPWYSP